MSQYYTFLCPKNITLGPDGHIKLDYSFCKCLEYSGNGLYNILEYLSLDYIDYKRFSHLSDFWTMGVVLFKMIFGFTPFLGRDFDGTITNIRGSVVCFPEYVSPETKSLILLLLNRDLFENRPSCQYFEDEIMNRRFFNDINWIMLENKAVLSPYFIKMPEYDLRMYPKLSTLCTTDYIVGDKNVHGNLSSVYISVHSMIKK